MSLEELIQHAKEMAPELGPCAGISAIVAALVLLLFTWPWRAPHPVGSAVAGIFGVSLGFLAGVWWLGTQPHWPPREDQDRLLLILLPATVVVELVAAIIPSISSQGKWRALHWLAWLPRLALATLASRILLHDTSYLKDLAGPGTRLWTPEQSWIILGGLAAALAAVWFLLEWLARGEPGRVVPLAVAIACAGAGIAVMMSGYASGGPLAMPLTGAVIGSLVASLIVKGGVNFSGLLGFGLIGLFALLVMGRFFGDLTSTNFILLFFAPTLCALPELPFFLRVKPQVRGFIGVILTVMPVAVALALAQQKMVENSAPPSSGDSPEPTLEDYMNFGK
jgi:hypothetical protein